ncbi:MAG: STAS domain-containing protein [Spirochaetes bacterium]|nr:STAS domain-containing protein [Spirochaetota bacterium]
MEITFEIIKISPRATETIDYNLLIIKTDLKKKVDIENANDLWIFLKTMAEGGAKKFIIDMKNLEYIDSSGIGVIINSAKLVRPKKGDVVLINVSQSIKDIFKVINLQEFIKIFNLEAEAINFFRYL